MRARRSLFAALFSLVALSAGVPADAQGLISFLPEKGVTLHLGSYDTAMSTAALLLNTSDADVPLSFQLGVFVDERGVLQRTQRHRIERECGASTSTEC